MAVSKPMSLNKTDYKLIVRSGLIFLAPVVLIYLTQVTGALSVQGHEFSYKDLIPSTFTQGGMVLFVLNRITDIIRKYIA